MTDLKVLSLNVQPMQKVNLKTDKKITQPKELNNPVKKNSSNNSAVWATLTALAATGIAIVATKKIKANNFKKLFEQEKKMIDDLPVRADSFKGNTIQERIQNILGKDSKITPHNYDLNKEYPAMRVYRDMGGYKDGMVTPKGIVDLRKVTDKDIPSYTSYSISHAVDDATNRIYNLKEEKRLVTSLEFKDPRDIEDCGRWVRFNLFSRDNLLTPAQRDFLRIRNNPKLRAEVEKILDELLKFKTPQKVPNGKGGFGYIDHGVYEHLDYDVILSVIQSLAKNAV